MAELTKKDLLRFRKEDFRFSCLTGVMVLEWFKILDAGWIYQGDPDPAKPHAELTSEKCSNGFFDCRRVLCYPNLAEIMAVQLVRNFSLPVPRVDAVIGSPYSAITFSYEVARYLGVPHFFTEKDPADPKGKAMVWKGELPGGSIVLQVEELITTLGTAMAVREAVISKNPDPVAFLNYIGTCVHRPDKLPADLARCVVVSLVERQVSAWSPEDCPYCKVGSRRVRPRGNWAKLIGKE